IGLGAGVARGPDQSLVRFGETPAAKIRQWVRLAPDHVVENPEAEVLQDRADAKEVVIGADDPQRRGGLHYTPAGSEPGARAIVVGGKARKLVPGLVDRIDAGIVGTLEIALQLQIIGGVGKYQID